MDIAGIKTDGKWNQACHCANVWDMWSFSNNGDPERAVVGFCGTCDTLKQGYGFNTR